LQEVVARKILERQTFLTLADKRGLKGNIFIKDNLHKFNEAAEYASPYIILTDLDDKSCPIALLQEWMPFKPHKNLLFRIIVHEVEAWILADRANIAKFLGVPASRISLEPERILKPKEYIFDLARKSKKHSIKEGIPPKGTARMGQLYNSLLSRFVLQEWSPEAASEHAPGLKKFIRRLEEFATRLALESSY
jgi:hypothetical protein